MAETCPIQINGETKGTLTVTAEGLTTVFDARCEDPGRLVRLSVYGGGREGYLGVMEPENGALVLRRRLSRAAMEGFPETVEYAAEAGGAAAPPPEREEKPVKPEKPGETRFRGRETEVLWHRVGDGTLYTVLGNRAYRAVPMAGHGLPLEKMAERRVIEGVEYAVFPLENGRIV
ncbi:MAG: hypothetical protein IJH47_01570 [Oscillospiraceae bacterium]|nr:hypothetical protein [Oscillospiraceae bacterium]